MANFDDVTLFGNTSLSDIFKQIHRNNKDTDKQINELIDALKPKSFAPSIKDLIYNYTNGITPPAPVIPPNPPGWGNINLAHGGMIERQPNDNRRYL